MSMDVEIYTQLKEIGIDPVLAREAANRFHTPDAAVDWCFGAGANVNTSVQVGYSSWTDAKITVEA